MSAFAQNVAGHLIINMYMIYSLDDQGRRRLIIMMSDPVDEQLQYATWKHDETWR